MNDTALKPEIVALLLMMCLLGTMSSVFGQGFPDLVPMDLDQWRVTERLGGPTLEFSVLTANIGGQDWVRPRDPDNPTQFLLRQIYEYRLLNEQSEKWIEVDRRRHFTTCPIDNPQRGSVFPCIQEHGPVFTCGSNQGISRGWADYNIRDLTFTGVFIGDNTGRFKLQAMLDPEDDLQRKDLADASRDGNRENNFIDAFFTWDGQTFQLEKIVLHFDPESVCR